jgi:hypothetical protein
MQENALADCRREPLLANEGICFEALTGTEGPWSSGRRIATVLVRLADLEPSPKS